MKLSKLGNEKNYHFEQTEAKRELADSRADLYRKYRDVYKPTYGKKFYLQFIKDVAEGKNPGPLEVIKNKKANERFQEAKKANLETINKLWELGKEK